MRGDVSLQIEREPDFFALSRARGDSTTFVVESDERIVGCVSSVRRLASVADGSVSEVGALADLKVHPRWRGQGVGLKLLEALAAHEAFRPAAPFVATTAAGNAAVERTSARFGVPRGLRTLASFTARQLLPLLPPAPPPSALELRAATPDDRDALLSLLASFHRRYVLAPPFDSAGFTALLRRSPGFDLASYRLAFRKGRLVAAVAAWEPEAIKRTRVLGMPWALRCFVRGMRAASRVLPVPALPVPGELLRFRYLRHPAHADGEEAGLRALVRAEVDAAGTDGAHFALLACADGDPLATVARGMPSTAYRYRLVAGPSRPEARGAVDRLAGALVYDDAALA